MPPPFTWAVLSEYGDFRFWHKADMAITLSNVRFRQSGRRPEIAKCLLLTQSGHRFLRAAMSASCQKRHGEARDRGIDGSARRTSSGVLPVQHSEHRNCVKVL